MEMELEALAGKVEKVVALVGRLQSDNGALRQRLAEVEAERDQLRLNMDAARARVEALMGQLPEDE
ncbi:hypothetical protein [Azovibrio restrictus]|uniref:hypothetical protein n=1 Tax=Azovibrio restrictus TaxID=146938 RepID=UPI0026F1554B|nr:hypothetical protein [Azovibrio restrictus]MDD3481703.1 hypothetical protein [Azovibrio restrictus]